MSLVDCEYIDLESRFKELIVDCEGEASLSVEVYSDVENCEPLDCEGLDFESIFLRLLNNDGTAIKVIR